MAYPWTVILFHGILTDRLNLVENNKSDPNVKTFGFVLVNGDRYGLLVDLKS